MKARFLLLATAVITLCALGQRPAAACTGIRIKPKDGSVISARTLEFAADLHSNVIVVPRAKDYVGTAPGEQARPPLEDRTTPRSGPTASTAPAIVDGLNEKGLAIGIFYFPGYAKYQEVSDADVRQGHRPLGASRVPAGHLRQRGGGRRGRPRRPRRRRGSRRTWALRRRATTSSTTPAVIASCWNTSAANLKIHENPLGVITNSPTFDWHVTNLRNYVNLTVTNVPPVDLAGIKLAGLGQGSGMLGLPGDFTPPSRFRPGGGVLAVGPARGDGPRGRPAGVSHPQPVRHPARAPPAAWRTASRWPTTRFGRAPPT